MIIADEIDRITFVENVDHDIHFWENDTLHRTMYVHGILEAMEGLQIGGDITTTAATVNLVNAWPTTVNIAGASTATAIGAGTGTTTIGNDLTVTGDVAVTGGDITSTGALTVTPNAGTNLNVALSTTGDFIVNSNDLMVDTSTGRVGIGTITPTAKIDVSGDIKTMGFQLTTGASSGYVLTSDASGVATWSNVTGAMAYKGTHDASGPDPIGSVTGDTWIIDNAGSVGGTACVVGDWAIYDGASWDIVTSTSNVQSVNTETGVITVHEVMDTTNKDTKVSAEDTYLSFLNDNVETMRLITGNRVGIGETAPTALLHLNPPTTTASQFRLEASAGINPSLPNPGDLWFNGTNLNFNDGTTTTDLLAGGGVFTLDTTTSPDKVYFTDGLSIGSADFIFGSDQLDDDIAVTTDDYRMFFDKSKGAFRAGYVDGAEWNAANVGLQSFATGHDTTASGDYSTAMGELTTASEEHSTAMGYFTNASGYYSTAMGYVTSASGEASTAMGRSTTAGGDYSTAMGGNTTASGNYSTAMGYEATAQAYMSTVLGKYNVISGTTDSWVATDPLFVIGHGITSGSRANALTVLKNGKVGIIEDTPTALLHLGPATTAAAQIRLDAT
ncbi:MAG: hypothetical protein V3W44_06325, partial [Dehalococcoidales bacterium]